VKHNVDILPSRSPSTFFAERSGFGLLALLAISSAVPFLVRSMTGFFLLVVVCMAYAVLPLRMPKRGDIERMLLLNVSFVALGLVVVVLSYLGVYDHFPMWPLKASYVIRQSYMIFLWLPLGFASLVFWVWNLPSIYNFLGRYGLAICAVMLIVDLLTSRMWGDQRANNWVGYVSYLDKLLLAFLFVLSAACQIAVNPKSLLFPAVMLAGFAASHALHLGILFNAQTGTILLVVLLTGWLPLLPMIQRARLVVLLVCGIHAVLLGAMFYEKPFENDRNTLWRLHAWSDNWNMVWQTELLGMGFGTPYHAQSAENLRNAALNETDLMQNGPVSLQEPQYFRGQHSSFVNIFYRMGVAGGLLFVMINASALLNCLHGIRRAATPLDKNLCFVSVLALSMQVIQMSLHVGLETPRFLIVYLLSLALAMLAPVFSQARALTCGKGSYVASGA
jgi:hypothetical protein